MLHYSIVWLDINSSDSESSFRRKLGDAKTFTEVDKCIEYIQSHPYESIYFIVSGSFAKLAIPQVYQCLNLVQIFLFCGSVSAHAEWAMDYREKLMIFDHGDDLLERLWNDLHAKLLEESLWCLKRAEEYRSQVLQYRQPCG